MQNLSLFSQALNQALRSQISLPDNTEERLDLSAIDLCIPVEALGQALFRELKLLEPYGMGNPTPKLLIRNCWFTQVSNQNLRDIQGRKVRYIKTSFRICDASCEAGFPGVWWEHYQDELPKGTCDAVVELDVNSAQRRYEVRLLAVYLQGEAQPIVSNFPIIADWRGERSPLSSDQYLVLNHCPTSWNQLGHWVRSAQQQQKPLALAYRLKDLPKAEEVWRQLVGVAKYYARTGERVGRSRVREALKLSDQTLALGLVALQAYGFEIQGEREIHFGFQVPVNSDAPIDASLDELRDDRVTPRRGKACLAPTTGDAEEHRNVLLESPKSSLTVFIDHVREEYFLRTYFQQVSAETIVQELQ